MFDPAAADGLQFAWLLPFEFLDLTPEREFVSLAVVTDDGTLFIPTSLPCPGEREVPDPPPQDGREFAFGIAARVNGREEAVASDAWAAEAVRSFLREDPGDMRAWLVRVERNGGKVVPLRLRGPEPVRPRRILESPTALLLDLGMVLTRFDRELFETQFRLVFGQPAPLPAIRKMEELRPALERGDLLADEFLNRILHPLGLIQPDRETLFRVRASILSVKRSTAALVRRLAERDDVAVVVVSNTDPIMMRHIQGELGLEDLTWNMAASCQDGVNPKGEDASLWARALETARGELEGEPETVIVVDDIRAYLQQAREAGIATRTLHYRSFAQFKYELGVCGLYVPLAREAPVSRRRSSR